MAEPELSVMTRQCFSDLPSQANPTPSIVSSGFKLEIKARQEFGDLPLYQAKTTHPKVE